MYQRRITKYNPMYRNRKGYYEREEWTSVYDIGRSFESNVLTLAEYLAVETKYVKAISYFVEQAGIDALYVIGLEKREIGHEILDGSGLERPSVDINNISEGCKLNTVEIEHVARLILREVIWAKLENAENQFFVHFGYAYYMYIGSKLPLPESVEFATNSGLFVESKASPHV